MVRDRTVYVRWTGGATYRDRSRIFRFTCFARASCTLAEYVSTRSPVVCKAGREIWHARGLAGAGFTEGGGTPASWPPRTRVIRDHAYVAHGGGLDVFRVGADLALERLGRTALGGAAIDVDAEATARSLRLLTHPDGVAMSPRRITVSTSGLVPEIARLGADFTGQINLAISLTRPTTPRAAR